jgi:transcription initiation factor IIE alpha subunit
MAKYRARPRVVEAEQWFPRKDEAMNARLGIICISCGVDCSFMSTCEGLCLSCGDQLQALTKFELIVKLVAAVREIQRLTVEVPGDVA